MAHPRQLSQWPLDLLEHRYSQARHGDFDTWLDALENLPVLKPNAPAGYGRVVRFPGEVDQQALRTTLMRLHPWRKGPFQIGQVTIDTEWRSDLKWQHIVPHLDLRGTRVLDIGCGNGYFGWRMLEAGATEVVGIDPTLVFCMQHQAIQHYAQDQRNWVLPLQVEELPNQEQFGAVFSMGVIYHRRDPQAHVDQLFRLTQPGGLVVLESIVAPQSIFPTARYARMRNVWCIPNAQQLLHWLATAGFADPQIVNERITTTQEQRSTAWMHFESLKESLDPQNPHLTVEGYPAPTRAVAIAHHP